MRGAGCAGCEVWGVFAGAGGASGLNSGGAQALHRAGAPAAQDAGRRHAPGWRARSARSAPDVACLNCLSCTDLAAVSVLQPQLRWALARNQINVLAVSSEAYICIARPHLLRLSSLSSHGWPSAATLQASLREEVDAYVNVQGCCPSRSRQSGCRMIMTMPYCLPKDWPLAPMLTSALTW